MKTKSIHAIRHCTALFVILFLTACGETAPLVSIPEGQAAAIVAAPVATAAPRFQPQTCSTPLVFPPAATAPNSIDFCRELIIIDRDIIRRLSSASFKNVMTEMFGADVGTMMQGWADSWQKTTGDELETRAAIASDVASGWHDGRFKLIAVVNRLDLAVNTTTIPRGEGRLVYQLFENGVAAPMTVIVEFDYPLLAATVDASIKAWADAWHALGSLRAPDEFASGLEALVKKFAVPEALRRIRTNEAMHSNKHWAFRQFDATVCTPASAAGCSNALIWVELPHTPKDAYHRQSSSTLGAYLDNRTVVDRLREGKHKFGVRYGRDTFNDPDWSSEIDNGSTWVIPATTHDEGLLLMAFNTCNGCHSDFKEQDSLPHIGIQGVGKQAILSSFLIGETKMSFPLPDCRVTPAQYGCSGDGTAHRWSEQLQRVAYLGSKLSTPIVIKSQPIPVTPMQYRYH